MILFLLIFILPLPLLIWFFLRSKTRKAKWIIGVLMILFVAFLSFMGFGLWALDIEDLYGDKQKIFWEGSSGDTVKLVDYNTKKLLATGILKKTWHRINVQSNNTEADILGWIENETGEYYIETSQEIKNKVITVAVWSTEDKADFIGAYNDPHTLDINFITNNFLKYKLTAFCEHQIPNTDQGLAKLLQVKNDTLVYKNSFDGNNLIISVWGEKGCRKAKICGEWSGKKANIEDLYYDKFWEK
ncbi:hypothetical protein [Pedobacter agri]|uniref:hypothetical protein n=1 Tax=Pedobacter agri TaxID=454586 RepID=UPI002931005D|nr:hypothetical protein [Pedobacter agri]